MFCFINWLFFQFFQTPKVEDIKFKEQERETSFYDDDDDDDDVRKYLSKLFI
jgi:hypothetical protein